MKLSSFVFVFILLPLSMAYAKNVDVRLPIAEGESQETITMLWKAITIGVEQGLDNSEIDEGYIDTWVRREGQSFHVKMEMGFTGSKKWKPPSELYLVKDAKNQITSQAERLIRNVVDKIITKASYVLVEGGTFQMGSTEEFSDKEPVYSVTVSSFYIGRYEVTQSQYESLMGTNPSDTRFEIGDNYPVNNVSWYDALAYANALSRSEELTPVYTINGTDVSVNWDANGYRLPTEAEWEYASRGGIYSRRYKYSGSNTIGEVAWYSFNSKYRSHSVGGKISNELGLYDMSGNAWEWVWDRYGDYSSESETDPTGASSGSSRVIRGGSWVVYAVYSRSVNRFHNVPSYQSIGLGFRLVLDD